MPINVLMPALSPTMTEGKLAKWLKAEGDAVQPGEAIAEIETDKATMEVEAVDEGVLGKILVAEGTEGVAINTPIAVLLADGEDASALKSMPSPEPPPSAPPAKPAERPTEQRPGAATGAAPAQSPAPEPKPPTAAERPEPPRDGGRIFASPLARRVAKDAGLELTSIEGSGPRGRIVKLDVERAMRAKEAAPEEARPVPEPPPAPAARPAAEPGAAFVEVPHSSVRKVIARRLSESKRDIPHYYLTIDCDIEALFELREKLNARLASAEGEGASKLSLNDFVVKAVALAMKAYPDANCSWTEDAIRYYQTVDVCVAVATPNGLITPVIRNADAKGLAAISNEIRHLASRAREGKLTPEEYQGGGFTVSNLGMYGIKEFAAIINPPQSCLLAVGAAEKRPVVKAGALGVATMMTCTLSADHRSVDGAKGAEFLGVFKKLIEDPLTMLL